MHLKRTKMPKTWPLARKGTKYLVRASHNLRHGIPLLIVLHDILGIVKTRKEAKKILNLGKVKVNYKEVRDEKFPLTLFDILSLDSRNFKLMLKNKKFSLSEVKGKEAEEKVAKVIGKKILKKGKLQINLSDGRNYLTRERVKVGDSVVISLKENKISEILSFTPGSKIIFITGKHLGDTGKVEGIDEKTKIISLKVGKEKINSRLESLMVVK